MANLQEKVKTVGTIHTFQDYSFEQLEALKSELSHLSPSHILWTSCVLNGELVDNKELTNGLSEKALKEAIEFVDRSKSILLTLHALLRPEF